MYSFCVEEQNGLAYQLEGLRVPPVVRGAARIFLRGGGWSYGSKSLEKEKLLM